MMTKDNYDRLKNIEKELYEFKCAKNDLDNHSKDIIHSCKANIMSSTDVFTLCLSGSSAKEFFKQFNEVVINNIIRLEKEFNSLLKG